MEGQLVQNAAPTQGAVDSGVTSTADTPMPVEAAPASHDEGGNGVDGVSTQANLRFQKLANEARRYREEAQRLKQESESLAGARQLHEYLTKNPQHAKAVMDLLEGRTQQPSQQDPFEGYQPHEAEALRAAMEFKQWKAEQERQRQQEYYRSIEENNSHLEDLFEQKLASDGFIDKLGNYDEGEVTVIAGAVLTKALAMAKDPNRITEKELNSAYDLVLKGTKSIEKRGLKSSVRTAPPPSASQRNVIPMTKGKETQDQRIARMAREYNAALKGR